MARYGVLPLESSMRILLATAAVPAAAALTMPLAALAQGAPQTVQLVTVALPCEQIRTDDKKIALLGAPKDSLKSRSEFKYAS